MNLQIRQMTLKDVIPLSKMYLSLSEEDRKFFSPFPFQLWKLVPILIYIALSNKVNKYIRKIFPKLAFLSLVAVDLEKQTIAGFAYLRIKEASSTSAYTANLGIVVGESYRGKKVGSILIKELINLARENNIKKITLQVVANNERAIQLYKKYGFKTEKNIHIKSYDGMSHFGYEMKLIMEEAKNENNPHL